MLFDLEFIKWGCRKTHQIRIICHDKKTFNIHCAIHTCFLSRIFCITGMAYAAVFPDPVLALDSTSFPSSDKGIAFSWISVGSFQPSFAIAYNIHNKSDNRGITSIIYVKVIVITAIKQKRIIYRRAKKSQQAQFASKFAYCIICTMQNLVDDPF